MNKILMKEAKPFVSRPGVIAVPFTCSDARDMHLHEPSFNRTPEENAMAKDIMDRIVSALSASGFTLVDFSFSSWMLYIKPTSPVNRSSNPVWLPLPRSLVVIHSIA
jgi:hypothetical protein